MRLQPGGTGKSRMVPRCIAILLLGAVACFAWSLSGPAGSTPDEDFHLASIWCGQGVDADHCGPGNSDDVRAVPTGLVERSTCYAMKSTKSAGCLGTGFGHDSRPTRQTDRGNFSRDYPPVYFAAMNTFVGDDISQSVLRMRAVNTMIFLAVTALVMVLVPPMLRRVTAWTFVLTAVPMGIWLISSINPSGWAVVSAGTLWICLYALPDALGWRQAALAVTTLLVALMGTGARTDSCLFTLIAVALVLVLRGRDVLRSRLALGTGGLVAAMAIFFFLGASQSGAAIEGFGDLASNDLSGPALLWNNVQALPVMWTGIFGAWPIGWVDTTLPAIVLAGSLLSWGAITFAGARGSSRRQIVVMLLLAGALVTYPLYLVTRSHLLIGEGVQPRYLLPLLVMLTGMALLAIDRRAFAPSRGQVALVVTALSLANAVSLHTNLRRYITGTDVVGFDLDQGREWWWNLPVSPMTVWAAGSLAFLAATWLVLTTFRPEDDESVGSDPTVDTVRTGPPTA